MSKLVECPMCQTTGFVTRVPNTGYTLDLQTVALSGTSWKTVTCPLCSKRKWVPQWLAAAFRLLCPDYGWNDKLGYVMIIDSELALVLRYCEGEA
jgi:hypothetical protein